MKRLNNLIEKITYYRKNRRLECIPENSEILFLNIDYQNFESGNKKKYEYNSFYLKIKNCWEYIKNNIFRLISKIINPREKKI